MSASSAPFAARDSVSSPRVLHVAAELFPWVKTGGLGDVAAALPPALRSAGIDVRVVVPGFPGFLDALKATDVVRLRTPFGSERVRIGLAYLPGSGVPVYLVDHTPFYDRPGGPYTGPDGHDWWDNHRRFALLGWVAAELASGADPDWRPEIVHAHDWHAGLAPAYMKARGLGTPSIFTVHNLAYQGYYPASVFAELALPWDYFAVYGVEYFGGLSFMKAGLFYADRLTTVSPTYAAEIQTPAYGMNLDGLLRSRSNVLSGILNGVDTAIWDPGVDRLVPRRYGVNDAAAGKAAAKAELQRRLGLADNPDAPLFGAVTRLTWQKGFDLMLQALPDLVGMGAQFALLGSGEGDLEHGFRMAGYSSPGQVGAALTYDEDLAHLIIAGSDSIVVPSRFEPCGLTQLYALRYGSLPLVRRTGGLADTVVDVNEGTLAAGLATGFVFDEESGAALAGTLRRAASLYADRVAWERVMRQAMTRDFSWEAAARDYAALYRSVLAP